MQPTEVNVKLTDAQSMLNPGDAKEAATAIACNRQLYAMYSS